MSDQTTLPPMANTINRNVRKLPAEPARWLLELGRYPATPEGVTALEIGDEDFGLVVLTPGAWRIVRDALNAPHRDRRRALFEDRNGTTEGSAP